MLIRDYHDFDLSADDPRLDEAGLRRFVVRVERSPVGTVDPVVQSVPKSVAEELTGLLAGLDERALDADGVLGLGEALADLLLPDPVRDLLVRSMDQLPAGVGLRIRIRLDPQMATFPWEYVHVARQNGQRDATGFLALDPRLSIVRDEHVVGAAHRDGTAHQRRIVVALASPKSPDLAELKLDAERSTIEQALGEVPGLVREVVERATVDSLTRQLLAAPTDILHFAGHGRADALILEGDGPDAAPAELTGEQLAVNLLSRGAQLAVLGACDSGLRSDLDPWSGVATRLIGAGVPAAVAMQYRIGDKNAVEFGRAFYGALAAGVPIDGAVTAGRLAIFNRMHPHRDDVQRSGFWRDWGVPVLYLREGATIDLATIADEAERAAAQKAATVRVDDRVGTLKAGGTYTGLSAGIMRSGHVDAVLRADVLAGSSTLVELDELRGGLVEGRTRADEISGEHTTVRIREIG